MKITLILLGAAVVLVGVWWFFIRRKPAPAAAPAPASSFSPGPSTGRYGVGTAPTLPPPLGTPGGSSVTAKLDTGVRLAATAGCAIAAGAYTGGAALPLCGLAGPLASGTLSGATGIGTSLAKGDVVGAGKNLVKTFTLGLAF